MRPNSIRLIVLGLAFLNACQNHPSTDDPEILKKIVSSYFEAIETKNFEKMKDLTTDDFVFHDQNIRYDTIRYAKEHYDKRINIFKGEALTKGRVIFLGNSLTEFKYL